MLNRRSFLLALSAAGAAPAQSPATAQTAGKGAFALAHSGLVFDFVLSESRLRQRLLAPAGFAAPPFQKDESCLEVAFQVSGQNRDDHHGSKCTGSMPGGRLVFDSKREERTKNGHHAVLVHKDPELNLRVESHYEFFDDAPVARRYTRVINEGKEAVGIEFASSAMLHGFAEPGPGSLDDKLRIHFAYNSWKQEAQWHHVRPSELGLLENGAFPLNGIFFSNTGSWSTMKYLPMGMVENSAAGLTWFWQIEHNGSWHWEISLGPDGVSYSYAGGPDEEHNDAWKNLQPGAAYQTVPVAVGCVRGGFPQAVDALTRYRRTACLRPHRDNQRCAVIFNDYMNCLFGDPTTEKELPLIEAAAATGCEYFVIDAGWYAERQETWWDAVGLWQPSKTRWSGGLPSVLQRIRDRNMIPGLWLELEVAGIRSPLKDKPASWFFGRHGKPVIDHSRFLLDFRNPEVRGHANEVIDRLVTQYGAGYIKMDYNVTGTVGTDRDADSPGQGMLEHQRAYLAWLDGVYARYPELIIENCGSGGGRMDYAMLSRHQLQSSSDQTDYRKYPGIVTGALAACLPEQLATWSYPLANAGGDEASFNMVNAMLCRIHQSGRLDQLEPQAMRQVRNGIDLYKARIRGQLHKSIPFFPLGTPAMNDSRSPVAAGLQFGKNSLIAVWRLEGDEQVTLPALQGEARLLYPLDLGIKVAAAGSGISLTLPRKYMGAIVEVTG